MIIACNEIKRLNYTTFVEAVDAGETIRGWIPDYKGLAEIDHFYPFCRC